MKFTCNSSHISQAFFTEIEIHHLFQAFIVPSKPYSTIQASILLILKLWWVIIATTFLASHTTHHICVVQHIATAKTPNHELISVIGLRRDLKSTVGVH